MMNERKQVSAGGGWRWLVAGVVVMLIVAAFVGGRVSGGWSNTDEEAAADPHAGHDHAADAEAGTANADADGETIYYCPMHPEQRSTNPNATCPECGMDMVAMPDDAGMDDDRPVLQLTDRSMALLRVRVMPASRQVVEMPLRFAGQLEHDETLVHDVVVRSESYIEQLHADYMYKSVTEGEVVAEVYSPQVDAAVRELLVLRDGQESTRRTTSLEAAKAKVRRLGVTADQVEQMLASDDVTATYQIRSPIAGHVMELSGREGHWLSEGQRLVRIINPSNLWVQLEAYERDLQWIEEGLAAEVTVEAYPGEVFEGEVAFVDPMVDERSRTARVRLNVPNPDGRLKPGMFARATVNVSVGGEAGAAADTPEEAREDTAGGSAEAEAGALVIPASAALRTGSRAVVYVQDAEAEQPTFMGREVVLGPRAGDYYLVREGIEEGELVVTHGAFQIDSELQIRGRPSMMAAGGIAGRAEEPADDWEAEDVSHAFAEQVATMVEHYFALSEAMAADELEAATEAAAAYREHLEAMEDESLEPPVREAWQVVAGRLRQPLEAMAEAEDFDLLRHEMAALSDATAEAAVRFGGGHVGPLYQLHCPMAHDDEGAEWLQPDDELRNPYMGQRMLRCGSVERQLLEE